MEFDSKSFVSTYLGASLTEKGLVVRSFNKLTLI